VEQLVRGVNRNANGLRLIGERAADGLLDPPGGVRGKLRALAGIKLLDRAHQADVAFVDQVEQRKAVVLIVAGNFHDQAQVRLDHVFAGLRVAFLDSAGQLHFLFDGQEFCLADFTYVKMECAVAGVSVMFNRRRRQLRADRDSIRWLLVRLGRHSTPGGREFGMTPLAIPARGLDDAVSFHFHNALSQAAGRSGG
jgi:hypothetical protein